MNDMDYAVQAPFHAKDMYLELAGIEERGERLGRRRRLLPLLKGAVRRIAARLAPTAGRPGSRTGVET